MSDTKFDLQFFIKETIDVIVRPAEYFKNMRKEGGVGEPVIKALIYGALSGVIWMFVKQVKPDAPRLFSRESLMTIADAIPLAIMVVVLMGVAVYFVSKVCKGERIFEPCFRVASAMMVLMPISALLSILKDIAPLIWPLVSILVSLFGVWLVYNALLYALNTDKSITRFFTIFLALIPVIMLISSLIKEKPVDKKDARPEKKLKIESPETKK